MSVWSNSDSVAGCDAGYGLPCISIMLMIFVGGHSRTACDHVIPQSESRRRVIYHLFSPGLGDLDRAIQWILIKLFLEHRATVFQSSADLIERGRTLFSINIQRR